MQLFICHASEDQIGFVEPLAKAIEEYYKVWYAPQCLTLGDRLLEKINPKRETNFQLDPALSGHTI